MRAEPSRTDERVRFAWGDVSSGPLAETFASLARRLLVAPPAAGVAGVLQRIVDTAVDVVPDADLVSITLRTHDGGFDTPVCTDLLAVRADEVQYRAGEGPCVSATLDAGTGLAAAPDLAHDPRWPSFGPAAAELGLRAVVATGLFPAGDEPRPGALNYYARTPGALDGVDPDVALLLAAHAAVALQSARAVEAAELRSAQLVEALSSRDVIGQAKGILMERRGLSADDAFDTLRRASQDLNLKLRDVARTVAERRAEL